MLDFLDKIPQSFILKLGGRMYTCTLLEGVRVGEGESWAYFYKNKNIFYLLILVGIGMVYYIYSNLNK